MENRSLRVLHIHNAGGQGVKFAYALRKAGCTSDCIAFESDFQFEHADIQVHTKAPKWLNRQVEGFRTLHQMFKEYDIFHFHTGSFLKFGLDLPLVQIKGKKTVAHFHGGELIRSHDRELARKLFGKETPSVTADIVSRTWLQRQIADHCLVSTPNLLQYIPGVEWLPQPIDTAAWAPAFEDYRSGREEEIRIVHCPSRKRTKGTNYVIEAVDVLRAQGLKVNLDVVHGVSHKEVQRRLSQGDIFVDQLIIGQYGNAAIEAMAMGLPTICYLDPALAHNLHDCPIVDATPDQLSDKLASLIMNPSERARVGKQSRDYVMRVHDVRQLSERLIAIYRSLSA